MLKSRKTIQELADEDLQRAFPESGSSLDTALDWARGQLDDAALDPQRTPFAAAQLLHRRNRRLRIATARYLVEQLRRAHGEEPRPARGPRWKNLLR
ncbi:hypothetical protein ACXET9_04050 [Brachybacterium sp. DNPG3]